MPETPEAALPLVRAFYERNRRRMDPDAEPVMHDADEVILYATAGEFRALGDALRAARGAGLDVERLARAITEVNCSETGMSLDDREYAADLAREYAALGDSDA